MLLPELQKINKKSDWEIALARYTLVQFWKNLKGKYNGSELKKYRQFLNDYNLNREFPLVYSILGEVNPSELYNWITLIDKFDVPFCLSPSIDNVEFDMLTDQQKQIALLRYELIKQWLNFRSISKKTFRVADRIFIKEYNSRRLFTYIFNLLGKTSIATLQRWNHSLKLNGNIYSLAPKNNDKIKMNINELEKLLDEGGR